MQTYKFGDHTVYLGHVSRNDPKYSALQTFTKNEECGSGVLLGNNFLVVTDKKEEIVFMLSYIQNNSEKLIEIYDVCTRRDQRGKGLASKYLKKTVGDMNAEGYGVWLGIVDPARINLYTRLGFVAPYLSNRTPLGTKHPFYFIGFIYKPGFTGENVSRAQNIAQDLFEIKKIIEEPPAENFNAYIYPSKYIEIYQHLLVDKTETGGVLTMDCKNTAFTFGKEVKGTPANWSVLLPCGDYSYHTHPRGAYLHYEYGSGLPSTADYIHDLRCNNYASLVFSVEGIYVLQYNKLFRKLLQLLKKRDNKAYEKYLNDLAHVLQSYDPSRALNVMNKILMDEDIYMIPTTHVEELYEDPEWRARIEKFNQEVIKFVNSIEFGNELLDGYSINDLPKHMLRGIRLSYISQDYINKYLQSNRCIPISLQMNF